MNQQLDEVVATYERANRIFTGLPVTCAVRAPDTELDVTTWEFKEGPVAWSIGSEIFFAPRVVEEAKKSRTAEAALAGLNFHELGHALYTPTPDSWLRRQLEKRKGGLGFAFNALEDQRIETLLAARYPALAGYFVQAFQDFVVKDTQAVYTSHLLAHGRQFLPVPLRRVLSAEFVGTWEERDTAEAIIDEYRTLILGPEPSDDAQRAVHLVADFHRLIRKLGEPVPSRSHGSTFGGAVATVRQVDAQHARELIENGHPVVRVVTPGIRRRPSRRARPNRPSPRRDSHPPLMPVNSTIHPAPVPAEYLDAARRFRTKLERLRADAEAGWVRREGAGRLNTQRIMLRADPDTAFDRWQDASLDATDIQAVLLLDASGSMRSSMTEACAAAWAIKRAIEAVGGKVAVYSYDNGPGIVYRTAERADARSMRAIRADGGNEPLGALQSARRVLSASHAAHRVLITLADGDWGSDVGSAHEEIDRLRSAGVITAIGLLGQDVSDDPHHHEHAVRLSTPAALVTMARQLVGARQGTPGSARGWPADLHAGGHGTCG